MVFIFLSTGRKECIMLDGFMPDMSSLGENYLSESINRDKRRLKKLTRPEYKKDNYERLLFQSIVRRYRTNFCNKKQAVEEEVARDCSLTCLVFEDVEQILTKNAFKTKIWKDLSKYMPTFSLEYENDIRKDRKNYIQNIIIKHSQNCSYSTTKQCCLNWIQETGFNFKTKGEYLNYKNFAAAWVDILIKVYSDYYVLAKSSI